MKPNKLAGRFRLLTRGTKWVLKEKIELPFNHYHAQGMVRSGELFYMSSVEIVEKPTIFRTLRDGYDRSPGSGIGHLFVFDKTGELFRDVILGEGKAYHPGGIDDDGTNIWLPAAEYRPHSRSIIYRIDRETMQVSAAFRVDDHIGGTVRDRDSGNLIGYSWGARTFYEWNETGQLMRTIKNPGHFIDYQDGHYVGEGYMLVSGVAVLHNFAGGNRRRYELGGLALIDVQTFGIVHEVPVTELSPQGHVITRNPVYVECSGEELRLYAVPDDDYGSLLVYETERLQETIER